MTHQNIDGNEAPASTSPVIEIDRVSSSDDLQDHHLQPQTIQWDDNGGGASPNIRRASSSASASRRPRTGTNPASRSGSNIPDEGRRPSYSDQSNSERDLALASPTLPPSAMPSALLTDNRSFKDNRSFTSLELPLPGISGRPREDSDAVSFPSSSGSSSRSVSPDSPRGEDFHRHHQRYHRRRRSKAHRRGTNDTRAFNIPRRPTVSDRERRPTVSDPRRPNLSDPIPRRSRAPTVSSVADSDDGISHVDSDDNNSEKAEEDVCFPMDHDDDPLRDRRGIDFEEMEEFAREMRDLLGSLDLSDEQRRAVEARTTHPIRRNRSGSRVSTVEDKREVNTALHHHPAFNPKYERDSSNDSIENEKLKLENKRAQAQLALPKLTRTGTAGSTRPEGQRFCRGDRKHDRFTFFTPGMEETNQAEEFCDLVKPGESYAQLFDQMKGTWWLDVLNPSVEEMKMLSKAFNIHPLTNEDIRTQESREKVELFRTYYFVCFRSFENDAESEDYLEAANMYIVVFRGGLLTFHFTNTPHAANVRRRIRQLRDYVSVSSDWICYALIDDITDAFGPLVHAVERETEAIEDAVMVARIDETGDMLQRLSLLRKKIMGLLKLLGGKADVIKMFAKRCNENWDVAPTGEIGLYLGDIQGTLPHNKC
jgi:magnesium transporter